MLSETRKKSNSGCPALEPSFALGQQVNLPSGDTTLHRRPTRFIPLGNRIALNEFDHIPLTKSQVLI